MMYYRLGSLRCWFFGCKFAEYRGEYRKLGEQIVQEYKTVQTDFCVRCGDSNEIFPHDHDGTEATG